MPKNLAYWEAALVKAKSEPRYGHTSIGAPSLWRKVDGRWQMKPGHKWARQAWISYRHRDVRYARRRALADRRVAYIQSRIEALRAKTAWTRLLREEIV